jgi:hypothetical protein
MVYAEEGRELRLACTSPAEPPVVFVPDERNWRTQVPEWAHERRALVIQRLRGAGCVLSEQDGVFTRTRSLDGVLLVESEDVRDDRSGLWDAARVIDNRSGEVIAHVHGYRGACDVRFDGAHSLTLSFHDHHERRTLVLDADRKLFTLDGATPDRPLVELSRALTIRPSTSPVQPSSTRTRISWLYVVGGAVLTLTGLWQLIFAAALDQRALGGLCTVFFAATTWAALRGDR